MIKQGMLTDHQREELRKENDRLLALFPDVHDSLRESRREKWRKIWQNHKGYIHA